MPSDARKIFDAFVRQKPDKRIVSFEIWLGENCESVIGLDLSQVNSFVDANKRRLWNYVKNNIAALQDSYEQNIVDILDEERMLFVNCQFDLLCAPRDSRHFRLGQRWALFDFADNLDWRQYEALAHVAAGLFGAKKVALTASGNEGGVDLYAIIPSHGADRILHGKHASYRIVGQSKKYADPVGVGKTREFAHVLNAIRHKSVEILSRVPSWFHEHDGPIIGWMNGHAGFQNGSIDIAKGHGILMSDTLRLCDSLLSVRQTPTFRDTNSLRDFFARKIESALRGEMALDIGNIPNR